MAWTSQEIGQEASRRQMVVETMRLTIETLRTARSKGDFDQSSETDERQIVCICSGLIAAPEIDQLDDWLDEVSDQLDKLRTHHRDCRRRLKHQAESIRMVAQAVRIASPKIEMD